MRFLLGTYLVLICGLRAPAQDTANGKRLYLKDGCYECHGSVGQGGTGPRLAPRPLAVSALIAYIRNPAPLMPPYTAKVLPDAQVADIRAYLASIPPPPPAKDIPLLNQ